MTSDIPTTLSTIYLQLLVQQLTDMQVVGNWYILDIPGETETHTRHTNRCFNWAMAFSIAIRERKSAEKNYNDKQGGNATYFPFFKLGIIFEGVSV